MLQIQNKQRLLSILMLLLIMLEVVRTPVTALAFSWNELLQIPSTSASVNKPVKSIAVVAILADETLLTDSTNYPGLSGSYPSLKNTTLENRIMTYARGVQQSQPFTSAVIIRVKPTTSVPDIAQSLEKIYQEGSSHIPGANKLVGIVTIGDVPLPVVNKGGNRYISLFPYTDFEDKAFILDPTTGDYLPNTSVTQAKPEIWHGVIKPPISGAEGRNLLAVYLDKNSLYHCKSTSCSSDAKSFQQFTRKLFFMDLINEFKLMNKEGFSNYKRYITYLEDLTYGRFNKHLLKKIYTEAGQEMDIQPLTGSDAPNDAANAFDEFADKATKDALAANGGATPDIEQSLNNFPDPQTRLLIEKFAAPYSSLFDKYLATANEWVGSTGRWDPSYKILSSGIKNSKSDLSTLPAMITAKDEYSREYLKRVNDTLENRLESFATDTDSDQDGMPDWYEYKYGLNPFDSADANTDADSDSYTNLTEYNSKRDPLSTSTTPLWSSANTLQLKIPLFYGAIIIPVSFETYRFRWNATTAAWESKSNKKFTLSSAEKKEIHFVNWTHTAKPADFQDFNTANMRINGQTVSGVNAAPDCSLYRGTVSQNGSNSVLAFVSHLNNVFADDDEDRVKEYGGCSGINSTTPNKCFPDLSSRKLLDLLGAKEVTTASTGRTDYRACTDFKEEDKYWEYVEAAKDFIANGGSTPPTPYGSISGKTLFTRNYYYGDVNVLFSEILSHWGSADGVDNDGDGTIDNNGEYKSSYGVGGSDLKSITERILLNESVSPDASGFRTFKVISAPTTADSIFLGYKYLLPYWWWYYRLRAITVKIKPLPVIENGAQKMISTFFAHKEPTAATITAQTADISRTPPSTPSDSPHYFTFRDSHKKLQTAYYPNVFRAKTYSEFTQDVLQKENELQVIAAANESNLPIQGIISDFLNKGTFDSYYADQNTFRSINNEKVKEAIAWLNMNIDQKHSYVLKAYTGMTINPYFNKPAQGYEAIYLVADGDAESIKTRFNGDYASEDPDAELLAALNQSAPPATTSSKSTQSDNATGAQSGSGNSSDEASTDDEGLIGVDASIDFLSWIPEMKKWVAEIANGNYGVSLDEMACSTIDSTSDLITQQKAANGEGTATIPGLELSGTVGSGSAEADSSLSAADTVSLAISADKSALKTGSGETARVTVKAISSDGKWITGDGSTKVQLQLIEPVGQSAAKITGVNPMTMAGGKAVFDIFPTDTPGLITLKAVSTSKPAVKAASLQIESTNRQLRLVSYLKESSLKMTSSDAAGFVIKDSNGRVIANVNGATGFVTIRDNRFRIKVIASKGGRPVRLGVQEISSGQVITSVIFTADQTQPIVIDPVTVDYFTGSSMTAGTHIKDINTADKYKLAGLQQSSESVRGSVNIVDESGKKVGMIDSAGNIFINEDSILLRQKIASSSSSPVIFEITDKAGTPVFEVYIVTSADKVTVQKEEGDYAGFNLISYTPSAVNLSAFFISGIAHAAEIIADTDNDGLNNLQELITGLKYDNSDTNGDQISDLDSFKQNINPLITGSKKLFSDLTPKTKGFQEIIKLFLRGVLSGYADGTFQPDRNLTREEFIKLDLGAICIQCAADRLNNSVKNRIDNVYNASPFPDQDIAPNLQYCVKEGKNRSIVSGYQGGDVTGYFLPRNSISRAEASKVLLKTAQQQNREIILDENAATGKPWYYNYVIRAQQEKLYPRGTFVQLDTYETAQFKKWFDTELTNPQHSKFITWLEGAVSRTEFALMVSKLVDRYDCMKQDTDADGIPDNFEIYSYNTNAQKADTDGGGVDDMTELLTRVKSTADGETAFTGDPLNPADDINLKDNDSDGITNNREEELGTDPNKADTDNGGINDAQEIKNATNPLDAQDDKSTDSDADGIPDVYEIEHNLNPYSADDALQDPDGDGLTNLQEYQHGTDPHKADTDNGGVNDGEEILRGTDPLNGGDDNSGISANPGIQIIGNTVDENYAYSALDPQSGTEGLIFGDQIPADGKSTLILRATIINEKGEIALDDNTSGISFSAISGASHAKIKYNTVKVTKGIAETEVTSTTSAGVMDTVAEIDGKKLPSDIKPLYILPLEPAKIQITPESKTIRSGGYSNTNLHIELRDIYNNLADNGSYTITVKASGPGSLDQKLDEDQAREGIQITTITGYIDLVLTSTTETGEIIITASESLENPDESTAASTAPVVSSENSVFSRDDIKLKLTPETVSLPSDFASVTRIKMEVTDANGTVVRDFRGLASFKVDTPLFGKIIRGAETEVVDGTAEAVFQVTNKAGMAKITVTVPGFDPAMTSIQITPKKAAILELEAPADTIESSTDATLEIKGKLYDNDKNFADNDSATVVTFRLTEASSAFAQFDVAPAVKAEKGIVSITLRGKDATGPINILAKAENTTTGFLKINSVNILKGKQFQDIQPRVLFGSLLGGQYGNTSVPNYFGGWFVFSGKSQAAISTTTDAKPKAVSAVISPNGLASISDPDTYTSRVNAHNNADKPNIITITDIAKKTDLAEFFIITKPQNRAVIADTVPPQANDSTIVQKITNEESYSLSDTPGGVNIVKAGNAKVQIMDNGQINLLDNSFTLALDTSATRFLTLTVMDAGVEIARVIYAFDPENEVKLLPFGITVSMNSEYPAGTYVHSLTLDKNVGFNRTLTGNSSNNPGGISMVDMSTDAPESQVPGLNHMSLERAAEVPGIGFTGDNKHMLLMASGNSAGEANMVYSSDAGITLGDPTVRFNNMIASPASALDNEVGMAGNGYTKDIGKEIYTGDTPIQDIAAVDYNSDGLKDVLLAYENGEIRLIENMLSNPRFQDQGILLSFPNGIISFTAADFNADSQTDIAVATRDSCKAGEVCVNLYLNNDGNFSRQSLNLKNFNENNRVYMLRAADMNGDGYSDLVTADDNGTIRVFYNHGDGVLDEYGQYVGNLGIHVSESTNLLREIAVTRKGEITNQPGQEDDMNFAKFQINDQDQIEFTYLDLDPILGLKSSKKGRDETSPFNIVGRGDTITYTVTLDNPSSSKLTDVRFADVIADNVTFEKETFKCLDCGDPVGITDSTAASRPYVFGPFVIPAKSSRTFKYSVTVKDTPRVNINVGINLSKDYPASSYPAISASPVGNTSGKMTFFYPLGIDPGTKHLLFGTYVSAPPDPISVPTLPANEGGIDLGNLDQDANGDGIPDEMKNFQDKLNDGSVQSPNGTRRTQPLGEKLDNLGDDIEAAIAYLKCSGGCLPLPVNFSFLTPGAINVMGIPGGFDPGLPIFGWAAPSLIPIWPPTPYQSALGGRIYLSPTLTGSLATGICLGPYLVGQCFAFKIADLLPSGLCDQIAGSLNSAIAAANDFVSGAGGDAAVSSDGGAGGTGAGGRNATGGMSGSASLGNYSYSASVNTNFRIPGFPAVITEWLDRQTEEVVNKLTDLPDIYFLYPDVTSMLGIFVPQEGNQQSGNSAPKAAWTLPKMGKINNFRQILSYINSIPVVQIEAREVLVKIPALTQKEIDKLQHDAQQWIIDTKEELERFKEQWSCAKDSKYKTICDSVTIGMTDVISAVEKNIEILEKYKEFPRKLLAWRNFTAKYLYQIICYLDAITKFTGGYIHKQQSRIEGWIEMIRKVKQTIASWKAIVNLIVEYQSSCDKCTSARFTLMELILKLFAVIPSPPIIPFPKLPDIYIDVSEIQVGLKILWPDVKFRPEPVILPKLPRLILPDIPSLNINLSLPQIPLLPEPPNLPALPDLPGLPIPTLPDIPPPPRVPEFPASVQATVDILKKIVKIMCLIKNGLIPVPETLLKSHVEQMTERPLSPLLPLDLGLKLEIPGIQNEYVDRIEVGTYINFELDFSSIYDFVANIADRSNRVVTNLVDQANKVLKVIEYSAQNAAQITNTAVDEAIGTDETHQLDVDLSSAVIPTMNSEQAIGKLYEIAPVLGKYASSLLAANKQMEIDAKLYAQKNSQYESIKLKASEKILSKDDPILNRSIAMVKAERNADPPVYYPAQKQLVALRDSMISFSDDQHEIDQMVAEAGDTYEIAQLLLSSRPLSSYIGGTTDQPAHAYAEIGTTDAVIRSSLPKMIKLENTILNDFADKIRSSLRTHSKLVADASVTDAPANSGAPTQVNKGIFIFNPLTGSNERLMNYIDEVDQESHLLFMDIDNDTDNDIFYSYGGNLYMKENYSKYPASTFNTYFGDAPKEFPLEEFMPASGSVDGLISNYNNNEATELSWHSAGNVAGYEVSYRPSPDRYILNNRSAQGKVLIINEMATAPITPPENATFLPEEIITPGIFVESVIGEVFFDGKVRSFLTAGSGETTLKPGDQVHTLTASKIEILINGESGGQIELDQNRSFVLPASYSEPVQILVQNGAVEIIDENTVSKKQKVFPGMAVEYDNMFLSAGGSAVVRMLDGSYARLNPSESMIFKKLAAADNPSVKLNLPNGFYYAAVSSFDSLGRRSTISNRTLMSPTICADKQAPMAVAGPAERQVAIFKPLTIDASRSFDADSRIVSYWLDMDPEADRDKDGNPKNDKDVFHTLVSPMDDPVFVLGPYFDLTPHKVTLNVLDEANNLGQHDISITVYVPKIVLHESTATEGVVRGNVDPAESQIPVSILRDRAGDVKKISTAAADKNGKYLTDQDGQFAVTDLNLKDSIVIKDSAGKIIAEINPENGRIIVNNPDYSLQVLAAEKPGNPTRIVLVDKSGKIITAIFALPDINTDTIIDTAETEYTADTVSALSGVHIIDKEALDNFTFNKIPANDANYPGGTEILDSNGKRIGVIDTGGNFYPFDPHLSLRLKVANELSDPPVFEIIYTDDSGQQRVIGEFYIAVKTEKKLSIISSDKFEALTVRPSNPVVPVPPAKEEKKSPFADVSPDQPYYSSIVKLAERHILQGIPTGRTINFGPEQNISRAEFAKIMLDIFCIIPRPEADKAPSLFSDITYHSDPEKRAWYYAAVKEAYFQKFVTGYLGQKNHELPLFKPDSTISRAEAVSVILRALQQYGVIEMGDPATDIVPWYKNYMQIAQDLRPYLKNKSSLKEVFVITTEESKSPEKAMTRAEFVAMADRVLTAFDCGKIDDDGDGMPNFWETMYGLNPHDPADANLDPDKDGLTNLDEYKYGTNPLNPDTDSDSLTDYEEIIKYKTDPVKPDSDGDGLTDGEEVNTYHTDPLKPDTDGDSLTDYEEIKIYDNDSPNDDKLDPLRADTDGDSINDGDEVNRYQTDPLDPDTDDGGVNDGVEIRRETDPLNPVDDNPGQPEADPRANMTEGIYLIQEPCNQCPCESTIDHTADFIPGDKVFGIISNNDDSTIFSRSNLVKIEIVPGP